MLNTFTKKASDPDTKLGYGNSFANVTHEMGTVGDMEVKTSVPNPEPGTLKCLPKKEKIRNFMSEELERSFIRV